MVENRQTKKILKKIKSLSVLDALSSTGCTKSSKFGRVMIVQIRAHDKENAGFFLFFQNKKAVISMNYWFFLEKSAKSCIFPIINLGVYLNNHNSFKFGAFGTTSWWKSI